MMIDLRGKVALVTGAASAGKLEYTVSKGGVKLSTKSVALEYAAENLRVNSVHPGVIWSDLQKVAIANNREQYDVITAALPMQRMGEPEDIGSMVAFQASDDVKYITGAKFVADGGMVAQ